MQIFNRRNSVETDPDPGREIFAYTTHFPKPTWIAKKTYNTCYRCEEKFKPSHQHNCRLCGHLFCSTCTGKFHVPQQYHLKGKKGAVRVCFSCRQSCLRAKTAKETKNKIASLAASPFFEQEQHTSVPITHDIEYDSTSNTIYPPEEWQGIESFTDCNKCHSARAGRPHNCRICGKLYCSTCSSKMDVPAIFMKKGKTGQGRVCDSCKFFVTESGATLSSEPLMAEAPSKARKTTVGANLLQKTYNEVNLEGEIELFVKWEGDSNTLCALRVDANADLHTVHEMFTKQAPQRNVFHYLCRGVGINKVFYDIFKAKHIHPNVFIRGGTVKAPTLVVSAHQASNLADVPEIDRKNNPYLTERRKLEKKQRPVTERKIPELKIEFTTPLQAAPSFKAPTKKETKTQTSDVVSTFAAVPQVSGDSLDEMLQSRSIHLFGALN